MLIIKNGTIYTMAGNVLENHDILITDGKIKRLEKNIDTMNDNVTIIDASGLNVYPGFIETHCHLGISEDKIGEVGDDSNESTNPITPKMRAIDAINPMDEAFHCAVASGITTVMTGPGSANPIGGQFACIKTHGRKIDDMIVKAPAAMKVAFGENPKKTYGTNGKQPLTRMAVASIIREELQKAKDYYDKKQKNCDMEIDYDYEPYIPLFKHEIPLKAHVHRLDDIFTAIRIAKEFDLLMTLDHCTEGHLAAEMLAESGFPALVGPSFSSRSKLEIKNLDFKTPGILSKAGMLVSIITDHPVVRIQYLPLCAGLAVKEGMDEYMALRAITIDAAKILGLDDRIGSIEIGKDADITIYKGNPLEIMGEAIYTIIDGKIVMNKLEKN